MLELHKGQANILPSRCLYTRKLINTQAETVKTKNAGLIFGLISDLNAVFSLEKDFRCWSVPLFVPTVQFHIAHVYEIQVSVPLFFITFYQNMQCFAHTHVLGYNVLDDIDCNSDCLLLLRPWVLKSISIHKHIVINILFNLMQLKTGLWGIDKEVESVISNILMVNLKDKFIFTF